MSPNPLNVARLGKDLVEIVAQPVYDPAKGAYMLLVRFNADGRLKTVKADDLVTANRPEANLG